MIIYFFWYFILILNYLILILRILVLIWVFLVYFPLSRTSSSGCPMYFCLFIVNVNYGFHYLAFTLTLLNLILGLLI